jgi:hypothetical protein
MAYLELVLFVGAIIGLIYWAQRVRLKPNQIAILQAVADAENLQVEQGTGTASISGQREGIGIRVHPIMGGWAVTLSGVSDEAAARAQLPDAQVGAGRVQLDTPLEVDAIRAAIARGWAAVQAG